MFYRTEGPKEMYCNRVKVYFSSDHAQILFAHILDHMDVEDAVKTFCLVCLVAEEKGVCWPKYSSNLIQNSYNDVTT